jgi:hypothetical protein
MRQLMDAKMLWPGVLTRLMACPPTAQAQQRPSLLRYLRQKSMV